MSFASAFDELNFGLRMRFSRVARRACEGLTKHMASPRVVKDREGISKYLSRWYPLGRRNDDEASGERESSVNVFLHCLHRSDSDNALHSHPWKWFLSIILVAGYSEERRVGDGVVRRLLLPLSINFIRQSDYHRLDLIDGEAWTLCIAGPKVDTWYFWDRDTKLRAKWDDYILWLRTGRKISTQVDRREL